MNCREVLKIYQLYVDDEMDESRIDDLQEHIENCPKCQYRVKFEVRFKTTITKKVKTESRSAPDELRERILQKLTR
jgi:mycothiol system anti-sigma-R factor